MSLLRKVKGTGSQGMLRTNKGSGARIRGRRECYKAANNTLVVGTLKEGVWGPVTGFEQLALDSEL